MDFYTFGLICLIVIILIGLESNFRCSSKPFTGPKIKVEQGVLQGRTVTTKSGFRYDSFQGIPYAKPPIGDLRFRNPQPPEKWNGVKNANATGNVCSQYEIISKSFLGSEDCLFLNVYVPSIRNCTSPLPVMVWIHGGGFIAGDGNPFYYGADYFVQYNVTLVTINYRLNAFGFLSLGTEDIPGNAGLKDQTQALKWVHQNIHHFCGDPEKVTIFGESAGAASVQYHMLSPSSTNLFVRSIMQSGTSLMPWALQKNPISVALELAKICGIGANNSDVGQFLKTLPEKDLLDGTISSLAGNIRLSFSPVIEKNLPGITPFITSSPEEILNSGEFNQVTTITGLVEHEGLVFRTVEFLDPRDADAIANNLIPDLKRFVPDGLGEKYGENGTDFIVNKIKQYYFPITENISDNFTDLLSDFAFVRGAIPSVKQLAKHSSPAFFYRFSYSGSINLCRLTCNLNYTGTAHDDELTYMFYMEGDGIGDIPLTSSDKLVSERLLQMWTDFAKFGTPTPQISPTVPLVWESVTPSSQDVITLDIDKDLKLISNPFRERLIFWNDLMKP